MAEHIRNSYHSNTRCCFELKYVIEILMNKLIAQTVLDTSTTIYFEFTMMRHNTLTRYVSKRKPTNTHTCILTYTTKAEHRMAAFYKGKLWTRERERKAKSKRAAISSRRAKNERWHMWLCTLFHPPPLKRLYNIRWWRLLIHNYMFYNLLTFCFILSQLLKSNQSSHARIKYHLRWYAFKY